MNSPLGTIVAVGTGTASGIVRTIQRTTIRAVDTGLQISGTVTNAVFTRAEPTITTVLRRAVDVLPIEAFLARVDVNALVGQVDVDALINRVDIDALMARLDLPRLVSEVLAEIELGDLIHDSTTGIAADARDIVRVQSIRVDDRLAKVIDKILLRRRARDVVVHGYTPGLA